MPELHDACYMNDSRGLFLMWLPICKDLAFERKYFSSVNVFSENKIAMAA